MFLEFLDGGHLKEAEPRGLGTSHWGQPEDVTVLDLKDGHSKHAVVGNTGEQTKG